MTPKAMALRVAIDVLHVPSRLRLVRSQPLPDGVQLLLRIAAGDLDSETSAVETSGRSRDVVGKAAAFFIEQVLLCAGSDSYRLLGTHPQASNDELRKNMALLLTWLHPDKQRHGNRSALAGRVTQAWNTLKTSERRAAYDLAIGNMRIAEPTAAAGQNSDAPAKHTEPTAGAGTSRSHRPTRYPQRMKIRRYPDHWGRIRQAFAMFLLGDRH